MSQLAMLGRGRFAPLFWTQLLAALDDNLVRAALVAWLAKDADTTLVAAGLLCFTLPSIVLSPVSGWAADRWPKARIIRQAKVVELVVAALALLAMQRDVREGGWAALALLGLKAAWMGPAKYAAIPELVAEDELLSANAWVSVSTLAAVLGGSIAGALLAPEPALCATLVLAVGLAGLATSLLLEVRPAAALAPSQPSTRTVRLSILGISYFWFLGAVFLTTLPTYVLITLFEQDDVLVLYSACVVLGLVVGALACKRLSVGVLELGIVPLGSLGFTVCLTLFAIGGFVAEPTPWHGAIPAFFLGFSGGIFSVPLYTLLQQRSPSAERGRVFGWNNLFNGVFVCLGAALVYASQRAVLPPHVLWLALAGVNLLASAYVYHVLPEFLWRLVAWGLSRLMYRVEARGGDLIPNNGAAVLVCNHVTFIDWLIIASVCRRPVRFVMYYGFAKIPVLRYLFRDAKVIPIAGAKEDKETLEAAFESIARELEAGEVVCIFPEGKLTHDGKMNPFRPGIERIVARTPVPVVPMALTGLWGSFFSRDSDKRWFKRLRSRVQLIIEAPIAPAQVTAAGLEARVRQMGGLA